MSAAVTPRHARHTAGLPRSIYLPRTADALAFAMSTYGIPLLVLAITRSAALKGVAFALEWIPRLAAFGWAGSIVDRRGAAVVGFLACAEEGRGGVAEAGRGVAGPLVPLCGVQVADVGGFLAVVGALQ